MTLRAVRVELDLREEFEGPGVTVKFEVSLDDPLATALLNWHEAQLLAAAQADGVARDIL